MVAQGIGASIENNVALVQVRRHCRLGIIYGPVDSATLMIAKLVLTRLLVTLKPVPTLLPRHISG